MIQFAAVLAGIKYILGVSWMAAVGVAFLLWYFTFRNE